MYRKREFVPPGRRRPVAVYFFAGAAAFCLMWIVIVLKHGVVGIGPSHKAVHYTAKDDPLVYWGTVVAFVGVLMTTIVLTIRAEYNYRETQKMMDELEDWWESLPTWGTLSKRT